MKYPVSDASVNLLNGKFTDGDPLSSIPRSLDKARDMNRVYDELLSIVSAAGLVPSEADNTQVLQAINILLSGADLIARFSTTANIALTGLGTQGGGDWGAALTAGDLILAKDQTTGSQNGWYVAAAGAWARVVYEDTSAEVRPGALTKISEGTTLADSMWMLTTDASIVLGTTSLVFARKDNQSTQTVGVQAQFKNLKIAAIGVNNANVLVTADEVCLENPSNQYFTARNANITINSAGTVGAINSSSSALAINTWYAVWLWWNGTTLVGTIDTSFTTPTAPTGYTNAHKARIGSVRTDSSGSKFLLQTLQYGRNARYEPLAASNTVAPPSIASGVSGSTAVSVTAVVPSSASEILVTLAGNIAINTGGGVASSAVYTFGNAGNAPISVFNANTNGIQANGHANIALLGMTVTYNSSSANLVLVTNGWVDNI